MRVFSSINPWLCLCITAFAFPLYPPQYRTHTVDAITNFRKLEARNIAGKLSKIKKKQKHESISWSVRKKAPLIPLSNDIVETEDEGEANSDVEAIATIKSEEGLVYSPQGAELTSPERMESPEPTQEKNSDDISKQMETDDFPRMSGEATPTFMSDLIRSGVRRPWGRELTFMKFRANSEWYDIMIQNHGQPQSKDELMHIIKWRLKGLQTVEINAIHVRARKAWKNLGPEGAIAEWDERRATQQEQDLSHPFPRRASPRTEDAIRQKWRQIFDELKNGGAEAAEIQNSWLFFVREMRSMRVGFKDLDGIYQETWREKFWAPINGPALEKHKDLLKQAWDEWGALEVEWRSIPPRAVREGFKKRWIKIGLSVDEVFALQLYQQLQKKPGNKDKVDIYSPSSILDSVISSKPHPKDQDAFQEKNC